MESYLSFGKGYFCKESACSEISEPLQLSDIKLVILLETK